MNMAKYSFSFALILSLAAPSVWAAPAAKAKKKPAPSFKMDVRKKVRNASDLTEASIRANIDNQKMILELEDKGDRNYPAMLIALADFYWDLSEIYERKSSSLTLDKAIYDAQDAKDMAKLAELQAVKAGHLAKKVEFQDKTVTTYGDVIRDYPSAPKIDEIRYFLGYHLYLMGRGHDGVEAYRQVILKHPTSALVPDALVNIGEYYFSLNDFQNALKLYEKAETYTQSPVHAMAIYKQGWCHYNLGVYDLSLTKFLQVIKVAKAQQSRGLKSAFGIEKDAANDLVLPYAKKGKAKAAMAFFRKYTPDRYLEVCGRLAGLYADENEYNKSSTLLRMLIKEARKTGGTTNKRYLTVRFQRLIVDNMNRKGVKRDTVAAVKELMTLFREESSNAPAEFVKKESDYVDAMILNIATEYHREWQSTKTKQTLEYTQDLYDLYLSMFEHKPNAYEIYWNNALLMMMVGRHEQAISAFEHVISMRPKGVHASDAAEQAVIAHLKKMQVKTDDVKNENVEDLTKRDLDPDARRFLQAVERWMVIIARDGTTPENAKNVPKARYLAAKLYYNANHFASAAKKFASFVAKNPRHEYALSAASHLLSCYNFLRDGDSLRKYADEFAAMPHFQGTPLSDEIKKIHREFNYIKCYKFQKKKEFLGAANCYLSYSKEHPDSEKAPLAIFESAASFFQAKRVEKSMQMQKMLYERYREHELAPKALYAIGNIFRKTAVFDQAAFIFEIFVKNHPKHPLAQQALRHAAVFRKTLGQHDRSVQNLNRFIKRYPKLKILPRVHLEIMLIRASQGKPGAVLKEGKKHFKVFKKESPAVRLQAHRAMGKAFIDLKNERRAREAFKAAVDYFETLTVEQRGSLGLTAISALAESHFHLGAHLLAQVKAVKLSGTDKQLGKAIKKKKGLLKATSAIFQRVIAYKHPGWQTAAYAQLGEAYSDFADRLENADVPKALRKDFDLEEAFRQRMMDVAETVRASALAAYRRATKVAHEKHWYNAYSQQAQEAIARLDLMDKSVKEFRVAPVHTGPNRSTAYREDVK